MAELVQLEHEGKILGLTSMNLSKTTIAQLFSVHEGLHLKILKNVWPLSNGKFLLPIGTKNAHVVAFPVQEQELPADTDDDDFQGRFGARYVCIFFCVCELFFLR